MLSDLKIELEQIAAAGREREFSEAVSRKDGCVSIRGRTVVDFTSWDRYGLLSHPVIRRAAQRAIEEYGFSAVASRASSGTTALHNLCERRLAEFLGFEAATLFSSKNQAVFSLITALASERDLILFDEAMQSPVGDAAYLVNAPAVSFPSGDIARVRIELEKGKGARRRLVCVESVSPITGEAIDLSAWCTLAQKAEAELVVDETYAIGELGLRGAGGLEGIPLRGGALCAYADCALSLLGSGAFVAGPATLVRYLTQRSRTFISEVSPTPVTMAVIEGAVEHIELAHQVRERIALSTSKLRGGLTQMGALRGATVSGGSIVGVPLRSLRVAREVGEALFQKGVLVEVLPRPNGGNSPSPDGAAFIRFLVSTLHAPRHIEDTLQCCSEIWPKIER